MTTEHDRLGTVERDLRDHAKSIGEIVLDQRGIKDQLAEVREEGTQRLAEQRQERAVRAVEDKHLDERLDRIEASLRAVFGLGKWLLSAIGAVLVVAIVGFVLKGGPLG